LGPWSIHDGTIQLELPLQDTRRSWDHWCIPHCSHQMKPIWGKSMCDRKGHLSYNLNQSQMCKDETSHKSLPCRVPGMGRSCHNSQIHEFSTWAAICIVWPKTNRSWVWQTFSQKCINEY
jgi:hypothetical protein